MAVLMVSGDALNVLPVNIYSAVSTMAASIAGELDSALTDPTGMAVHALGALGLILLMIAVAVNLAVRAVGSTRARHERWKGVAGRGGF
jgi:phosphate transport system permease protein